MKSPSPSPSRSETVGRWAPSPTGELHLGSAATALLAWLSVRSQRGRLVWRVEDLDGPRSVAGMNTRHMEDLGWLGLDWDEGPDIGGRHPPYRQSESHRFYIEALRRLDRAGRLFPCDRSRKELGDIASAPHETARRYPRSLRPSGPLQPGWLDRVLASERNPSAVRLRVDDPPIRFVDRVHGEQNEDVGRAVGDFVLRRRDGIWAYQLAVVVDDGRHGVTEVVRGADLLDSTGRQIVLQQALGLPTPSYAHGPVLVDSNGRKLSKRHGSLTIRSLRERSVPPQRILAALARALGILDHGNDATPQDLLDTFRWDRVRTTSVVVTDDWLRRESLR